MGWNEVAGDPDVWEEVWIACGPRNLLPGTKHVFPLPRGKISNVHDSWTNEPMSWKENVQMNHPNIAPIHKTAEDQWHFYLQSKARHSWQPVGLPCSPASILRSMLRINMCGENLQFPLVGLSSASQSMPFEVSALSMCLLSGLFVCLFVCSYVGLVVGLVVCLLVCSPGFVSPSTVCPCDGGAWLHPCFPRLLSCLTSFASKHQLGASSH